ncbi:MAG: indole-3-glycerol phosphate synthase TrpC [Ignavibacteriae bacterium]|nr:indole-3-glycerol phosphate synthase TrpC [Ignavibacteriota bacterium]
MTILDEIISVKKDEVKFLRQNITLSRFKDYEFFENKNISLFKSLNKKERISVIAEIKKASPSRGIIRKDFNHLKIAEAYMNCEVDGISILTDKNYFKGNISFLNDIAKYKNIPLLRKDFIIDEYQVYEAKANGADAILLIAEALSKNQIAELTKAAYEINLEVLLELHSEEEIEKIDFSLNKIIGINNRDLKTFKVDLETTKYISEIIPKENLIISESGISTKESIDFVKSTKAKAVLVGEHFMKSDNIEDALKKFRDNCYYEN